MTEPNDLLAEAAKYNQHFGNLRIAAEGGQPTYANDLIDRLAARVRELEAELETERMRLAAVGVAAHGGSIEGCLPEYRNAAVSDVASLYAELTALRADKDRLAGALREIHNRTGCWMYWADNGTCRDQALPHGDQCTPCFALTAIGNAAREEET